MGETSKWLSPWSAVRSIITAKEARRLWCYASERQRRQPDQGPSPHETERWPDCERHVYRTVYEHRSPDLCHNERGGRARQIEASLCGVPCCPPLRVSDRKPAISER